MPDEEDIDPEETIDLDGEVKVIFCHEDHVFLEEEGYEVLETYDLKGAGWAAKVKLGAINLLQNDERVDEIEDADEEFDLFMDPSLNDESRDRLGTIEDYRRLNHVPASGNTGKGMTVAVTDSGLDETHPIFSDLEFERHDFTGTGKGDNVGHGTGVMGQIIRLAPDIEAVVLKIFGNQGRTSLDVILKAYEWLLDNTDRVDLVNMSWGSSRKVSAIDRVHNKMVQQGIRDVTAAGNSGGEPGSPATATKSFAVGACDETGKMADFSSHSDKFTVPEVTSIGKNCRLAQAEGTTMGEQLPGRWVKASGTSFSSPAVCGIAAKYGETKNHDVKDVFSETAEDVPDTDNDGNGLVHYKRALEETPDKPDEPEKPEPIATTSAKFWAFAGNTAGYIRADWPHSGDVQANLLEDGEDRQLVEFIDQ